MRHIIVGICLIIAVNAFAGGKSEPQPPKILLLVADGVGYNYFDILEALELRGATVATVGYSSVVRSCRNRESREVTVDYVLADFPENELSTWDALIIPSGGHHELLGYSSVVEEFILLACRRKLIVGGICTGMAVLGRVDGLLDGVSIARNSFFVDVLRNAGAAQTPSRVQFDRRILTGSTGGSVNGGGYEKAPTEGFVERLMEEIG